MKTEADTDLQTFAMIHAARERAGLPCWFCEVWAPSEQDRPHYITRFYWTRTFAVADAEAWLLERVEWLQVATGTPG